jgi:tetratricopeptide (TPR) repeat protein
MSNAPRIDDTQPRSPFEESIRLELTIDPEGEGKRNAPGCGVMGLIGGVMALIAVAIVGLAAAAGWTAGQREANANAVLTREAAIQEQLQRIPGDIASGNTVLLDTRLRWLATLTPGVPALAELAQTATALASRAQATTTPTTVPTSEITAEAEATVEIVITPSGSGYDLAALFGQAQAAMSSSRWDSAIELLDVILAVDESFQTSTVRRLMSQALQNRALELYNANQPAAANLLVNRAEEFGQIDGALDFERYAAELYLTARAAVGTGSPTAIRALQSVIELGTSGRYYAESQQLLYNQYVLAGDAYAAQSDYCSAAGQYQFAMSVFSSGTANGKYDNAQFNCLNATPSFDPNLMLTPGAIAPVGVVITPSS